MTLNESQKWTIFLSTIGLGILIYLLSPILMPFFVAALLSYLGDPLVDRLETFRLSRTLSVVIVFIILFFIIILILLFLVPLMEQQISYLAGNIPKYIDVIQNNLLPWLANRLGLDPQLLDMDMLKKALGQQVGKAGSLAMSIFSSVTQSGLTLLVWLGNLVMIPVITFYLLRDWDLLMARIDDLLPRKYEPVIAGLARESDDVLAAFLRGQFMVMIALGIIYSIGLWIAGLKLALLIGMMAGMVSFVPYLGFILGIIAASIAMLLQTHELIQLLPVFLVFGIGQALEGMVLTPLLVGDRIGLHPVAVIFSVLAGGQLFGFIGILLALPVAAVIAVLLRHAQGQYKSSDIFNDSSS